MLASCERITDQGDFREGASSLGSGLLIAGLKI